MRHRAHFSAAERATRSKLTKIVHDRPFVCGSLIKMRNQCGKPNCKCAGGERHESLCLSIRVEGKRKMLHVPKHLEKTVTEWVEDYKQMKALMEQVSECCLARFLATKADKNQPVKQG